MRFTDSNIYQVPPNHFSVTLYFKEPFVVLTILCPKMLLLCSKDHTTLVRHVC
jgi:hypothetical protein